MENLHTCVCGKSWFGKSTVLKNQIFGEIINIRTGDNRTHNANGFCYAWLHMLIGYARVSTDEQDTRLQIDALKRAGCEKIYEERASGSRTDRPELNKALAHGRRGDVVVVWKLDRLGRSLPHLIDTVHDLEERKVGFRSLTDNIDTTTASGRMFFHMMGALAQFERDLIRERTMAGLKAARERGNVGGRPRKLKDTDLKFARSLM